MTGTPFASLLYIPHLLLDDGFRRRVLGRQASAGPLGLFWGWFDNLSSAEKASAIAPLMNKLRPFTLRSSLRALVGQVEPKFDPIEVFTKRRVLLVPLRKGLIGTEAANLIGSLVMSRLWQLTLQRSQIPAERRHGVFAYLDEFQDYLHLPTDFADVLAQARGLGLGLVLAHQHLGQLNTSVRDAVLANAQSRVCFRLGHDDAARMARGAGVLEADDFTSLGAFETYMSLLDGGETTAFASARTFEPTRAFRSADRLGRRLAEEWGRQPGEIEGLLRGDEQPLEVDEPIGRKKRGSS
ncbi:MAG: type IV secretory system conjugative DNA transfer family protein [Actinomycetia bacterium]|nr:type IV secretory system conjugative DNA transfer family protein [Actinomycetes bacterium]